MSARGRVAVTRDVDPSNLLDLRARPPRATVAFVDRDEAIIVPVRARYRADTYGFGVAADLALENREVVLVIDDGPYWFDLRGISVRGVARRLERAEPGETDALAWYAIEPQRILAWDYAAMREV